MIIFFIYYKFILSFILSILLLNTRIRFTNAAVIHIPNQQIYFLKILIHRYAY